MNRFRFLWGWISQIKHRLSWSFQVFNGNSRSLELCCLIIIHAFCRYITGRTKRKMLDMSTCDFYCVTRGVPTACVQWPGACKDTGQIPAGWATSVGGRTINLQYYKYRGQAQIQSQPSVCGCAEVTSVRIQFKSPMITVALNQASSLSSSTMSFRNPEKQSHPDFILRRTLCSFLFFLSFFFLLFLNRFNWCEGR